MLTQNPKITRLRRRLVWRLGNLVGIAQSFLRSSPGAMRRFINLHRLAFDPAGDRQRESI
jgi:hypothetical protein